MQFKYRAVSDSGHIIEGLQDAKDKKELVSVLKGSSYMPISVEKGAESGGSAEITFARVKKKDMAVFCRQFHTMLNSGVSVVKSLDILERQTENKLLKRAISSAWENVQKGMTLSEALKENPRAFPSILINMVEAGEVSGSLDTIMERMAVHFEKEFRIENKIKGAMLYPIVLACIATAVVVFMMVAVLPTFVGMFESSGVRLPLPTRILLAVSHSIRYLWHVYILGAAGLVLGLRYLGRSEAGRLLVDTWKFRLPVIKNTNVKIATSKFNRTLSTILSSGIPLIQGIELVSRVLDNRYIEEKLENVQEGVRKGMPLSETVREARVFPPMVDAMIKIGEESGDLDGILSKTADFYDEEVEAAIQRMTEIMQPLMIVIMALIVGFIVISIALPMFDMVNMAV
ncbi:MAG: type II secretion system F family protein [Clostridiaceae bacterium]|jgi:type IV pilus assembly protein PilC|nr:type II secretion system F family protein [Clostridiaceae bacterium]